MIQHISIENFKSIKSAETKLQGTAALKGRLGPATKYNKCDGLLPLCEIEMLMCDSLPAEMLEEIARFQAEARSEVGDKDNVWKPGGRRR
jgi:hypothetical protein